MAGLLAWAADVVGGHGNQSNDEDEINFSIQFTEDQQRHVHKFDSKSKSLSRLIQDLRLRLPPPLVNRAREAQVSTGMVQMRYCFHVILPEHKEEGSSDDEHPDSRKGRSKFERWTSHKERDFNNSINSKSSTSLKFKEIDKKKNGMTSETSKIVEEPAAKPNRKVVEVPMEGVDNSNVLEKEKNAMVPDSETKPVEDNKHSDTVEKLKKRSERFKLSIPGEKSASAIKVENEAMPPPVKSEAPANSDIKPERPARKRRWVGN